MITNVSGKLDSSTISDKSLDINFKTLKVVGADVITTADVITNVSGDFDSSAISDKSMDGKFKTLKVMDADVQPQSSNLFIPTGTAS